MVIIQALFGTEMDCLARDWSEGDVIGLCDKKLYWQQTQYFSGK